ncbi:hypothetical protein ACXEIJ_005008 [Klebsiella quasipneumoniae]|uniref:hypothetical protein n=1 Tax=Klebsiella pneumoniae TaxID=573 RepID=UPI0036D66059
MDEEIMFSLSYEQLTRIAEERIRECDLDSQGAKYISESGKASALLVFWYELAIHGAPLNNYEQIKALINVDHQHLRKIIWPEADRKYHRLADRRRSSGGG